MFTSVSESAGAGESLPSPSASGVTPESCTARDPGYNSSNPSKTMNESNDPFRRRESAGGGGPSAAPPDEKEDGAEGSSAAEDCSCTCIGHFLSKYFNISYFVLFLFEYLVRYPADDNARLGNCLIWLSVSLLYC
jgi:hypothetical protein